MEAYVKEEKEYPEDYKWSNWNLKDAKVQIRRKLEENNFGKISLGNFTLGREFAWDYLRYLEDGGEFGPTGFKKFVWSPNQNKNKFFQKRFESS